MCDSTLFHILREQNISLSAFVPTNAMLAKKRTENFHSLSFSVGVRSALWQVAVRRDFSMSNVN